MQEQLPNKLPSLGIPANSTRRHGRQNSVFVQMVVQAHKCAVPHQWAHFYATTQCMYCPIIGQHQLTTSFRFKQILLNSRIISQWQNSAYHRLSWPHNL